MKPVLVPVMDLLFASHIYKACQTGSATCDCSTEAGVRSGIYLHMMQEKGPGELASDPCRRGATVASQRSPGPQAPAG